MTKIVMESIDKLSLWAWHFIFYFYKINIINKLWETSVSVCK
jgi:hypothetical protein